MVYEKSALGFDEFATSKRTLSVRERQVLLLVNGVRKLDDLEKFFKKELLDETIQKLASTGFIIIANSAQASNQHTNVSGRFFLDTNSTNVAINPVKMAAVKNILLDATDDYLGLMGRALKDRIDKCIDQVDLRACVSSWHMAMRESKLGRESTDFLLEQIHQTLENNMQEVETAEHQTH